ncbi:hypothetical protein HK405_005396, partial [Cladochytrium tenue]
MGQYGRVVIVRRNGTDAWGANCTIRLELREVSRLHVRLAVDPSTGDVFVEDLSSNGTLLNGAPLLPELAAGGEDKIPEDSPITRAMLAHGDTVGIEGRFFRFEYPPGHARNSAAATGCPLPSASPPTSSLPSKRLPEPLPPSSHHPVPQRGPDLLETPKRRRIAAASAAMTRIAPVATAAAADRRIPRQYAPSPTRRLLARDLARDYLAPPPTPPTSRVASGPVDLLTGTPPAATRAAASATADLLTGTPVGVSAAAKLTFRCLQPNKASLNSTTPQLQPLQLSNDERQSSSPVGTPRVRKVTFGPKLSPEIFDHEAPVSTPVKRGDQIPLAGTPRSCLRAPTVAPSAVGATVDGQEKLQLESAAAAPCTVTEALAAASDHPVCSDASICHDTSVFDDEGDYFDSFEAAFAPYATPINVVGEVFADLGATVVVAAKALQPDLGDENVLDGDAGNEQYYWAAFETLPAPRAARRTSGSCRSPHIVDDDYWSFLAEECPDEDVGDDFCRGDVDHDDSGPASPAPGTDLDTVISVVVPSNSAHSERNTAVELSPPGYASDAAAASSSPLDPPPPPTVNLDTLPPSQPASAPMVPPLPELNGRRRSGRVASSAAAAATATTVAGHRKSTKRARSDEAVSSEDDKSVEGKSDDDHDLDFAAGLRSAARRRASTALTPSTSAVRTRRRRRLLSVGDASARSPFLPQPSPRSNSSKLLRDVVSIGGGMVTSDVAKDWDNPVGTADAKAASPNLGTKGLVDMETGDADVADCGSLEVEISISLGDVPTDAETDTEAAAPDVVKKDDAVADVSVGPIAEDTAGVDGGHREPINIELLVTTSAAIPGPSSSSSSRATSTAVEEELTAVVDLASSVVPCPTAVVVGTVSEAVGVATSVRTTRRRLATAPLQVAAPLPPATPAAAVGWEPGRTAVDADAAVSEASHLAPPPATMPRRRGRSRKATADSAETADPAAPENFGREAKGKEAPAEAVAPSVSKTGNTRKNALPVMHESDEGEAALSAATVKEQDPVTLVPPAAPSTARRRPRGRQPKSARPTEGRAPDSDEEEERAVNHDNVDGGGEIQSGSSVLQGRGRRAAASTPAAAETREVTAEPSDDDEAAPPPTASRTTRRGRQARSRCVTAGADGSVIPQPHGGDAVVPECDDDASVDVKEELKAVAHEDQMVKRIPRTRGLRSAAKGAVPARTPKARKADVDDLGDTDRHDSDEDEAATLGGRTALRRSGRRAHQEDTVEDPHHKPSEVVAAPKPKTAAAKREAAAEAAPSTPPALSVKRSGRRRGPAAAADPDEVETPFLDGLPQVRSEPPSSPSPPARNALQRRKAVLRSAAAADTAAGGDHHQVDPAPAPMRRKRTLRGGDKGGDDNDANGDANGDGGVGSASQDSDNEARAPATARRKRARLTEGGGGDNAKTVADRAHGHEAVEVAPRVTRRAAAAAGSLVPRPVPKTRGVAGHGRAAGPTTASAGGAPATSATATARAARRRIPAVAATSGGGDSDSDGSSTEAVASSSESEAEEEETAASSSGGRWLRSRGGAHE